MNTHQLTEKSYVLGTHDAEIARLGVQHNVWRSSVLDLWRHGGLTAGQTIMDIGAGPGDATLDLAEIAGPEGRVIAIERSQRFLAALERRARARGVQTIDTIEADLFAYDWPGNTVDRVWCRWVLAFLPNPAKVLRGITRALKPGGKLLIQEYYDYGSWRLAPHAPDFEAYVARIIARWRAAGGNADIGLDLPRLLPDAGLEIEFVRPVVMTLGTNEYAARWPMGFAREHMKMMHQSGDLTTDEVTRLSALLDSYEADPNAMIVTPGVLQIVARKTA